MLVMGKGNIKLQVEGLNQVITFVYFVPDLKNNVAHWTMYYVHSPKLGKVMQ